ncbi:MobA/MobL family protein [Mesorhizobium sp. YR577]|uniref:MobA/MobL family protein n=1 Tax=Mesorhizobium sp. YR577 TaxID=1884373 RepID=UPI0008E32EE3|nr:MobA/MobL family protein [Mesorhizobium sp. YR577]SFU09627.1 MobA/MobL family protein [Mesorhizobium sp. YR577]
MADFFRIQLGVVSRGDGHSAAKRSAYQSCGKTVDHEGRAFDFRRKAKEHVLTMMFAPESAPDWSRDPEELWQRAAAAEKRIDAQEARIVDFSMPRQVPETLWEACIRHVYAPLVERGMVFQIDIHDTLASDSGRNINIHGLASLRPLDGDDFSKRKDRTWNDLFRERSGRAVREMFAARLTAFCQENGIPYEGDARPNSERDLPEPEPQLPKWNFEAFARTGEKPEALAALHGHRSRRREWEAAKAQEIEATLELDRLEARIRGQRRINPAMADQRPSSKSDRRAAILKAWHKGGWIEAETIPAIAAVRFDRKRNLLWIDLTDGTTLVDRGDAITMKGRVTWSAALETAAAAKRHGWTSVQITGDQAYKDAVAVACLLRGIEVTNHVLSPKAQAIFDRLRTEQMERSRKSNEESQVSSPATAPRLEDGSSLQVHQQIAKRRFVPSPPLDGSPEADEPAPAYRPRWKPPISTASKSQRRPA